MSEFTYTLLTDDQKRSIMTERLHQLEASHFRVVTELRLATLVDPGTPPNAEVMLGMASIEVQATALREWIADAPEISFSVPVEEPQL